MVAGALDAFVGTPDPQMTGMTAAVASWLRTRSRLAEMVGHLGWLDTRLPVSERPHAERTGQVGATRERSSAPA